MSTAAIRATLLRAAIGVDGLEAPSSDSWTRWRDVATVERVTPLLYRVSACSEGRLDSSELEEASSMHVGAASLSVRLEQAMLAVAEVLDASDVPYAVLKGVATANIDYAEASQRQFGDVDLLVAPPDFGRARQAIQEQGWHQAYPLPRHHEPFTHAVTFGGVGIAEIDLHQRIGHRALGLRILTDELLAARIPFDIAGHRLWALGDADRLIHACIHAVASRGHYRRLSSVADVLVLSRGRPGAAPDAVLDRAEQWRVRPLVEAGVRLAHAEARLDMPSPWARAMARPTRHRDRLVERAYLGDVRRPAAEEIAHLRSMGRWRDRALYLYGHLHMESGPGAGGLGTRVRYLRSRLRDRS